MTATDQFAGAGEVLGGDPTPIGRLLAESHWQLVESRPAQLRGTPGRFWLCRHQVRARDDAGRERALSVCVEARRRSRPMPDVPPGVGAAAGPAVMAGQYGPHRVWVFPFDPDLPELPAVASGAAARTALAATGLIDRDEPVAVTAELLRYRAGRRAVARYLVIPRSRDRGRWRPDRGLRQVPAIYLDPGRGHGSRRPRSGRIFYGKVLRPHRVARVRAVAEALEPRAGLRLAIPVPYGDGLLLTRAMAGTPLRTRLLRNQSLPAPARLAAVSAGLARPVSAERLPAPEDRRHPVRLADYAADLLGHVLPSTRPELGRVVEAVGGGVADGWEPTTLVHGDLYDDQVFVDEEYGLGLIDLDDAGLGDPVIDAANLCAHLLAMAAVAPGAAARLAGYHDLVRSAYLDRLEVSPREFAWREALAVLLLATGPFRVLAPDWARQSGHLVSLAVRLTTQSTAGGGAATGRTL